MENVLSESFIVDEFVEELNGFHEQMYKELERAIDSDTRIYQLIDDIADEFRIWKGELESYIGARGNVSASAISVSIDREQRYAAVRYLRSAIYYGSFSCVPSYMFGRLLGHLEKTFSKKVKKKQLANLVNISKNDFGLIKRNNDGDLHGESQAAKKISAKKQYEILSFFHSLCYDPWDNEIEEFNETREMLETILGMNLFTCVDKLYSASRIQDDNGNRIDDGYDYDKELAELSKSSGIRLEDIYEITENIVHPYYPRKLHELFCSTLDYRTNKIEQGQMSPTPQLAELWKTSIRHWKEQLNKKTAKNVAKLSSSPKASDVFIALPDILKDIIFNYANKQEQAIGMWDAYRHYSAYTAVQDDNKYIEMYENKKKTDMLLDIIELFRALHCEKQDDVLEYLHENLMPCFPPLSHKYNESTGIFAECAIFSFFLSSLVDDETLNIKYHNAKLNNDIDQTLYMKEHYHYSFILEDLGHRFISSMIDFSNKEWQLAGYIESAIAANFPITRILEQIY